MYIEKRYIKKIENIFEQLSAKVQLLDAQGVCIAPENGGSETLPPVVMAPGITHRADEKLFRSLDMNPPMILVCAADVPGAENLLIVADAMMMSIFKSSLSIASHSDVFRRVLKQDLTGADLVSRASEHQIPMELERCIMLFQIEKTEKASAYSLLGELIPLSDTDTLVEMNRHLVALVKDMNGIDGSEELVQFAQAVQETLLEEAVQTAEIGIGESKQTLALLAESYQEAKRAMEVGHIFSPEKSIFVFNDLLLERFLMNVPREESMHYHALLFNRKTAKLFNDEMLQTIEMFFRKDLNLSDTARQLYIHRNTLVYRLDKVQRQTGLDLRKFDNAVTFKILHELKKCGQEKPKQIY
ncbi:MAG: helix-turn-helix domain-containing protein [Eubacteriales bacterium]|nr:helix-turn-helix domain-containing protein [Eubacteriales bacterium]